MRESVGSVALYYIIIVFLIVAFSFLSIAITYSRAYRVNTNIINAIELYEGYNTKTLSKIDQVLEATSYRALGTATNSCPVRKGASADAETLLSSKYEFCVYLFSDGNNYYHYGVLSYMYLDIPIVGNTVKIPIYSNTKSYYRFPKDFTTID